MIIPGRAKNSTLMFFGTATLAIWSSAQHIFDRSGRSSDLSDFAFGVLFGVGAGLLMLLAWRIGRQRNHRDGPRSH